jgi:hypothetical protein
MGTHQIDEVFALLQVIRTQLIFVATECGYLSSVNCLCPNTVLGSDNAATILNLNFAEELRHVSDQRPDLRQCRRNPKHRGATQFLLTCGHRRD